MINKPTETSNPDTPQPFLFVENAGQFDRRIRFALIGGGLRLSLTDGALWLTLVEPKPIVRNQWLDLSRTRSASPAAPAWAVHLKLSFVGAKSKVRPKSLVRLPSLVSYLHGSEPKSWHRAVPVWSGVVYPNLYQGADLFIQSNVGGLELRIKAKPEISLDPVVLRIEGAQRVMPIARSRPGKESTTPLSSLRIFTALGETAFPLIVTDRKAGANTSVKQVGTETFDVSHPFAGEGTN